MTAVPEKAGSTYRHGEAGTTWPETIASILQHLQNKELNMNPTPASIFEQMGLRYLGPWQMPGRPEMYCFDALDGSTLLMAGPVSVESVLEKLAEHEEVVNAAKNILVAGVQGS